MHSPNRNQINVEINKLENNTKDRLQSNFDGCSPLLLALHSKQIFVSIEKRKRERQTHKNQMNFHAMMN